MKWLEQQIDRAIGLVSPELECKRKAWRAQRNFYEAAAVSKESADWMAINRRAEDTNKGGRDFIRARGRDKERNSDILNSLIGTRERNIIGVGFRVQAQSDNENLNTEIEKLFEQWQDKENCDITGEQDFWEICKLALRRSGVDGGILFIKTYGGNKRFPFQLQAREVDDLDDTVREHGENIVVGGIEINKHQKAIAYHLKKFTPEGWYMGETERITANRVIRLWDKTRPTQIREMSPLAASLKRINEVDEYIHTISVKEKVLACVAAFIKRAIPNMPFSSGSHLAERKERYGDLDLYPGMIAELQIGDDISTVVPNGQAANAKEFITIHQRLFGAGQGLSHEATSRDLSEVTYSSARQGLLEDQKTYADRQKWLISHFLKDVYKEFFKSAVLAGTIDIQDFWSNQEYYLKHRWIGAGWSWIDPQKETNANRISVETGQDNLTNICARQGLDYREVREQRTKERLFDIEQLAKELAYKKEMEEKYGITMTTGGEENGKNQKNSKESAAK